VVSNTVSTLWAGSVAPYGDYFGESGTRQSPYLFTGEILDGGGLCDLRARRYAPGVGVFASRDPFEGVSERAMSLNGYSWVEGNTPNHDLAKRQFP
jgi:RHS repeat-associated protein